MYSWRKWKINKIEKENFPDQLKGIKNCPKWLYYRGEWDKNIFKKSLAIIGSRRMSRYGREVIAKFMPEIVANKISVISGFMYGIDTEAHRTCLNLGGKTVAVLGSGLDQLTPDENDDLYSQILASGGVVISEYEPEFKATLWSFPQRNRIVSGLSTKGILIVEAGMKSGSLITARLGAEQGRKVWAIPGPITSSVSAGTNWLIDEGKAKICLSAESITQTKFKITQENLFEGKLDPEQKAVWELLKIEPLSIDEISRKINKSVSEVSLLVTYLSLDGLVFEENGKVYLRTS